MTNNSLLPEYVLHLLMPGSYPHPVDRVELIQTHISFVTLAGAYVYKWKKPVDFGFVDFSTLEKREFYCRRELFLNRRLCPEIYLDIVWLTEKGQSLCFNGDGKIIEFGVKMARMPEAGMLHRVIEAGLLRRHHLDSIIDILVPFYHRADRGHMVTQNGKVEAIARNISNNFSETLPFVGSSPLSAVRFAKIKHKMEAFLLSEEFFAARRDTGCICDCHGDLYSNNICLAGNDKIHIFDCLEFNDNLRFIDTCADVAFLAMDLDFHGLFSLSDHFIDRFIEKSGDIAMLTVLNFYKCYRAYVRGKVGLLASVDAGMEKSAAQGWLQSADRYFQLAEEYAEKL
jgi:uncharacterized protein